MSVVVTLCDFFYNISKLMAVIYSDPNLTKNVVKNYTPKNSGTFFTQLFDVLKTSLAVEKEKKNIRGGVKNGNFKFQDGGSNFLIFFPTAKKFLGRNL